MIAALYHRSSVWTLHGNSVVIATIYHRSSVWTLHGNGVVIAALYHRSSVWTLHGNSVVIAAIYHRSKLQAMVYDILPLEEDAGKRCSECVIGVVYGHCMGIVW